MTDDWILSQVVFDEEAEASIPAAVLQIKDRPPQTEAVVLEQPRQYVQKPLNLGPSHGVSLTSFLEVGHRPLRPISIESPSTQTPSFRGTWVFNPFLMLIGDPNLRAVYPDEIEGDPSQELSPSHVAGPGQLKSGNRAIGLSAIMDVDHPSPADLDFIPDAVSSFLGTREQDASRYKSTAFRVQVPEKRATTTLAQFQPRYSRTGCEPQQRWLKSIDLSLRCRERDASRHNRSNPQNPTQVLMNGTRAATTLAQIRITKPQVLMDRVRQQAQIFRVIENSR